MSDAFSPPNESVATQRAVGTTTRVLAIVAIGLGVIGFLLGLTTIASLAMSSAIQGMATAAIPAQVRPAYQDLLDAQGAYLPIGATLVFLAFGLSIAQFVGGVLVLRSRAGALLSWVALGNAAYYVVANVVWTPIQTWLIWPAMQAYLEAARSMPGGDAGAAGAQAGSVGGVVISVFIGLAMAGFWAWVWTATRPTSDG